MQTGRFAVVRWIGNIIYDLTLLTLGVVVPGRFGDRCRRLTFCSCASNDGITTALWRLRWTISDRRGSRPATTPCSVVVVTAHPAGIPTICHRRYVTVSRQLVHSRDFPIFPAPYRARTAMWSPAPRQMAEPIRPLTCAAGVHQALAPVLDVASEAPPGARPRNLQQRPVPVVGCALAYVRGLQIDDATTERGRHHQALRGVFSI